MNYNSLSTNEGRRQGLFKQRCQTRPSCAVVCNRQLHSWTLWVSRCMHVYSRYHLFPYETTRQERSRYRAIRFQEGTMCDSAPKSSMYPVLNFTSVSAASSYVNVYAHLISKSLLLFLTRPTLSLTCCLSIGMRPPLPVDLPMMWSTDFSAVGLSSSGVSRRTTHLPRTTGQRRMSLAFMGTFLAISPGSAQERTTTTESAKLRTSVCSGTCGTFLTVLSGKYLDLWGR